MVESVQICVSFREFMPPSGSYKIARILIGHLFVLLTAGGKGGQMVKGNKLVTVIEGCWVLKVVIFM